MLPISKHLLSDLVCDSKLEATVSDAGTLHITYRSSPSARRRRVRTEERWVRDGCLGRGAYGTVYKERCEQGSQIKIRAVKEIKKSVVTGEEIDYARELEAVAKFSHARVGVSLSTHSRGPPFNRGGY
jgi:calcium/calmodulin-dependent protein kinase I